jgi:hypothetical protein
MNPHWVEYKALMRGDGAFSDSLMAVIIFKRKLSAVMKFIQNGEVLGRATAFVWRMECQKRGLPNAHVLFWTDFNTQDIRGVESVINVRYPRRSPFLNDQAMVSDFQELIDAYQIYHHSKRGRLLNGNCPFAYPQKIAEHTRIRGHKHHFARDAEEGKIVPHNPMLLAHFRCHHRLEVIHSEQCIG